MNRGRGGFRGRGRGRGGFRGRGRGGRRGNFRPRRSRDDQDGEETNITTADIDSNPQAYFTGNCKFDDHYDVQTSHGERYTASLAVMMKNGVDISQNAKVRLLAAAWARGDHDFAKSVLYNKKYFGFTEIHKAVLLLDAGRNARVAEKRLKRLQFQQSKVHPKKMGKVKSELDNLNKIKPSHGSASGAVCKQVKRWVQTLTKEELEFYALHFPLEPWKKLADICHFHPEKDFAVLPGFLSFCFGLDPPEFASWIKECRNLNKSNINDMITKHPVPFAHIKALTDSISDVNKGKLARDEPKLDTVLWYYENIHCKEADEAITDRLARNESLTLATGKLLERLLTIHLMRLGDSLSFEEKEKLWYSWDWDAKPDGPDTKPKQDLSIAPFFDDLMKFTEERMKNIKLSLDAPIVIMGDRSPSMEVAIKTSSVIAGILTAITSAKLVFFDDNNMDSPFLPKTIQEVLTLATLIDVGSGTTPAASLMPFYFKKEVVKTIIVVTDEEENGEVTVPNEDGTIPETNNLYFGCDSKEGYYNFAKLYQKYYNEVYPARLVFVSFVDQTDPGQIVSELKGMGFNPLQFKFHRYRPDLSKLDSLFALLSLESNTFEDELKATDAAIKEKGLEKVFQEIAQSDQ
ncbi:hypothetical protein FSP39_009099 [Pinctada imbricata]|uniref:Uncharacterized protein n=1 Tax=Pinctada imbricata TaxID=66713 RepID=A0AA89C380_PINIB|nr:hypothetical protein FSP39_009099 [Pinctada imbricata]